jgi:hypothetical protein
VIWEPFVLALVLGIIVSAALYFAYLWPSVEPEHPTELPKSPDGDVPARKTSDARDTEDPRA